MVSKEVKFYGDYTLRYGWGGLEALTDALDTPAFSDFDRIISEIGPKHLRKILWAGLLHKFPNLTDQDMFQIMDGYLEGHSIAELSDVVGKALLASGIISAPQDYQGDDTGEVQDMEEEEEEEEEVEIVKTPTKSRSRKPSKN